MNSRLVFSHLAAGALGLGLGLVVMRGLPGGGASLAPIGDPVAALGEAVAIEEPRARIRALLDFFDAADPAGAKRLRESVNEADSPIFLDETGEMLFAAWWAEQDPEAAFQNLIDPAWSNRHPWLREVMRAWVKRSPADAAAAAAALPPNPNLGSVEAARVLVDHWWDDPKNEDAAPILALINTLDTRTRGAAIYRLLEHAIEMRGVEATERIVEAVPESEDLTFDLRQEMFGRYVQNLVDKDIDAAVRFASKHARSREGLGVMRHLAFSWGGKDGPAAMRWAMDLPDTAARNRILVRAWLSYRKAQPELAAQWLAEQDANDVLMPIFQRYLLGTGGIDPKKALALAERATTPENRQILLAAVGTGWMKADPQAATEWLETAGLPPELEAQVRQGTEIDDSQELLEPNAEG